MIKYNKERPPVVRTLARILERMLGRIIERIIERILGNPSKDLRKDP
jgi:hypothetical protein